MCLGLFCDNTMSLIIACFGLKPSQATKFKFGLLECVFYGICLLFTNYNFISYT